MSRRNKGRYHNTGAAAGDELSSTPEADEKPAFTGFARPGLADVIARREAELTEELGEAPEDPEGIEESYAAPAPPAEDDDDDGKPPEEAPPEEKPAEPKAPDAAAKPKEPEKPAAAPQPEQAPTDEDEIELVVDGAKVKKTKTEILEIGRKAAQKELAADRRLEEAARIKREAEEYAARLKASPPPAGTTEQPKPGKETAPTSDHDTAIKEARKAVIEANQYGDAEDIEKAQIAYEEAILAKAAAVAKPAPQAVTQLDPRAFREQLKRDEIAERFTGPAEQGGFADVWEDPELRSMVMAEVDRALDKGAKDTDWTTYENAGKKVRAWRDFQASYAGNGTPPAPPAPAPAPGVKRAPAVDPTLAARADKKRQLPSVPTASGKAAVEDSTPTEEQNPASVIASMARSRPGQRE